MTRVMTNHIDVRTANGSVRGLDRGGSIVFYAIPYAAAPIGELTFALPTPPDPWTVVRDATRPGPTAQCRVADGTIPEPSLPGTDILTVNVFTPDPSPTASMPVLVWFHGGAYIAGSPISPWYDGYSFNQSGIVVVTVGYRLGVMGFGLVPDAPPNRAVHDWLAALRWVRENIGTFGGDPDRVTIAGQSAGGGAVLTLLGVEGIAGLASQAVACSPVFTQMTTTTAAAAMDEIAGLLGKPGTAEELAEVSNAELDSVVWRMKNAFGAAPDAAGPGTDAVNLVQCVLNSLQLSPLLDDELIQTSVSGAALSPEARDIPLLIGSTAEEFNGLIPEQVHFAEPAAALNALGVRESAACRYLECRADRTGSSLVGQVLTDLMVRSSIAGLAEQRDRTWVYDFRWRGNGQVDPGLAFHCLDLPFAWNVTERATRVTGPTPTGLAHDVHTALTEFVRSGDPGWSPYGDDRTTRYFDESSGDRNQGYLAELTLSGIS